MFLRSKKKKDNNRNERRVTHPVLSMELEGQVLKTVDWGRNGCLLADYQGNLKVGDRVILGNVTSANSGLMFTTMPGLVVRRKPRQKQIAVRFAPATTDDSRKLQEEKFSSETKVKKRSTFGRAGG
ncbi:MAG: hypothetical protein ACPGO3_11265 [Magnetospiraceae bacterium]